MIYKGPAKMYINNVEIKGMEHVELSFVDIENVPEFYIAMDRWVDNGDGKGFRAIELHSSICGKWDANGSPVEGQ